jgi:hypothetical protein
VYPHAGAVRSLSQASRVKYTRDSPGRSSLCTSFYAWKRRLKTHAFAALKDLPPIHKSHPQTKPPETAERITVVALEHPGLRAQRTDHQADNSGRYRQADPTDLKTPVGRVRVRLPQTLGGD